MADTQRTIAEMITAFAANTTNAINSQDFRDLIETMRPRHASMHLTTAAATTITVAGTYYKASGTTTALNLDPDFTMPASNRLQYNGAATVHVHVAVTLATTGGNSKVLAARVAYNGDATGADAVGSQSTQKTGTGADVVSTALHFDSMMSAGDYLELWVTNETDTTAMTVEDMYFFIMTMPA